MNRKKLIIIGILLITIVNILIVRITNDIKNSKKEDEQNIQKYNEEIVKEAYRVDPSILVFDDDNRAILSIEKLLVGVTNGKDGLQLSNVMHDKNQDACVGYFIVIKDLNGELLVDGSHICDMVDY